MPAQSESILTIILGPKRMSAAEAYLVDGELHVSSLGDIPAPLDAFDGGQIASGESLGRVIAEFMTEKRVTTTKAVMMLPEGTTITQLIKLPTMPREEMVGAVRAVAERYAIFAEHEISVDCCEVEALEEDGNPMSSVLLSAARTANVEQCRECARVAGLDLIAVEAVPAAAARAYRERFSRSEVVALAVVGEAKTDVMIFDGGVLRLCYGANAGIQEETEESHWSVISTGERDPFAAPPQLYSELTHCFRFFQNQFPGKGVQRVIITADHSRAEQVASDLAHQLQVPVELGRPAQDYRLPTDVDEAAAAANRALTLALIRGSTVAVSTEGEEFCAINLLPTSRAIWLPARGAIKVGVALMVLILVGSIIWAVSLRNRITEQETRLDSLRNQIAVLEPQLEMLRAVKATEQALRNEVERATARIAKERAVRWSQILVDVADRLPRDMWLMELSSPDSSKLKLAGVATNRAAIPNAIESLGSSPYLNNVVLGSLNKDETYAPGRPVIRYQINAKLYRGMLSAPPAPAAISTAPSEEEAQ
jgi:Tfp pilus assembly PilM family ATPase/Tfp pilus assembly protein PilN